MRPRDKEPIARGVLVALHTAQREPASALAKESASILRALQAPAEETSSVPAETDYVIVLVGPDSDPETLALPDLRDRAATAVALGPRAPETRATLATVRKRLRSAGAVLGARELVLLPEDFGYLGLESDGLREKLEELLRALVADAERLRLKREGWEDPIE